MLMLMFMLLVGVAAFNKSGATLHSALKIPVEDGHSHSTSRSKYKQLRLEALQDMRQAWHGVRYLISDEISMISNVILQHASKHWQEIKGMRGVPFGGLGGLVITVGDFYQLPPVKAPFVFESATGDWQRLFKSMLPMHACLDVHFAPYSRSSGYA